MSRELPSASQRGSVGARSLRPRVSRIESRRELAVSGEPAGFASLIKANASAFTFLGITLGAFVSRKFFVIPVGIAAMLVQDAVRERFASGPRRRTRRRRSVL